MTFYGFRCFGVVLGLRLVFFSSQVLNFQGFSVTMSVLLSENVMKL